MLRNDLILALAGKRENDVFVEASVEVYDGEGNPTGRMMQIRVQPYAVRYDPRTDCVVIDATEDYD